MKEEVRTALMTEKAAKILCDMQKPKYQLILQDETQKLDRYIEEQFGSLELSEEELIAFGAVNSPIVEKVQEIIHGYLCDINYLFELAKDTATLVYMKRETLEHNLSSDELTQFRQDNEDAYLFIGYREILLSKIVDHAKQSGLEMALEMKDIFVVELFQTAEDFLENEYLGLKAREIYIDQIAVRDQSDPETPLEQAVQNTSIMVKKVLRSICTEIQKEQFHKDAKDMYG